MSTFIKRLEKGCTETLPLSEKQITFVNVMKEKLAQGIYKEEKLSCLCGADNDKVIAEVDRYGFSITTKICLNCALLRSDPYYTRDTLNSFYNLEFDEVYRRNFNIDEYFEGRVKEGFRLYDYVKNIFPGNEKLKVFDIGCGSGGLLQAFVDNGHDAYGCDLGATYLNYGKSKGLNLEQGEMNVLSKHGLADLIILNHVLEHFTDPGKYLAQIKPLLKENGHIYIAVPGVTGSIRRNYGGNFLYFLQNSHAYHFSLFSLSDLLSKHGFKLVKGTELVESLYTPGKSDENFDASTRKKEVKRILSSIQKIEDDLLNIRLIGTEVRNKDSFIRKLARKIKNKRRNLYWRFFDK